MNCAVREVTDLFTSRNGYLFLPIPESWAGRALRHRGPNGSGKSNERKKWRSIQETAWGPDSVLLHCNAENLSGNKVAGRWGEIRGY